MPDPTRTDAFRARAAARRRSWRITRYASLDAIKDAEYAFWVRQPTHVAMAAIAEMTRQAYAIKGVHVRRLQRPHRAPQ